MTYPSRQRDNHHARRSGHRRPALVGHAGVGLASAILFALSFAVAAAPSAGAAQLLGTGYNGYGQLGNGTTVTPFFYGAIPGLSNVAQASPGYESSLFLLTNGTVDAVGSNESGELGDESTSQHLTPQPVAGLSSVTAVAAGEYHSLALLANGTVEAWGYNPDGQVGDGEFTTTGCGCVEKPTLVKGIGGGGTLEGVVAISAGEYDSMALLSSGRVVTWGEGTDGQLGNEAKENKDYPVEVVGVGGGGTLEHVKAISAGGYDNMALLENGTVLAWGYGDDGELGDGGYAGSDVPVQVQGVGGVGALSGVTAISAGLYFNMALLSSGTVDAWGDNEYHELGNGTTEDSDTPVPVPGVTGATAISAGGYFGQALLGNATLDGWGYAYDGELGNPFLGAEVALPQPAVAGVVPGGIVALTHGDYNYDSLVLQGAVLGVSSSALTFASQATGTHSAAQTVTVKNEASVPLVISGDALTAGAKFAKSSDTCAGATLAAGTTCSIGIEFSPTAAGQASATLAISSNAANPVPAVALTGTGFVPVAPTLSALSLSQHTFRPFSAEPSIITSLASGTVVSYKDSQAATTKFTVGAPRSGVVKGKGKSKKCSAAPKHVRKGTKRCTLYKSVGSFSHTDTAGANSFRFSGWVDGHALPAGNYRLVAVATSSQGRGSAQTTNFKIEH